MTTSPWKVIAPIGAILVGVFVALFAVKAFLGSPGHGPGGFELAEGAVIVDFSAKKSGGGEVKFSELKSKVVMINFWATWCPACVEEMPSIANLRKAYLSQGFDVLAINEDENPEAVLPGFLKKQGLDIPVYLDLDGSLSRNFDVHGLPLSLLVSVKDRRILMVESGERDWNSKEIHQRLDGWLAQ